MPYCLNYGFTITTGFVIVTVYVMPSLPVILIVLYVPLADVLSSVANVLDVTLPILPEAVVLDLNVKSTSPILSVADVKLSPAPLSLNVPVDTDKL